MSTLNPSEDDRVLAAEYVLGVLTGQERQAFAARLASEAGLRTQVLGWEQNFAPLNADYAGVNPPPSLRGKLHAHLFGAGVEVRPTLLNSLAFWRGLSFAAVAALALVVAVPYAVKPVVPATSVAELALQQGGGIQLAAYFDPDKRLIHYKRVTDAAASGRDFELWAIIGKNDPVSLGVVPSAQSGIIMISAALAGKLADATLAISDEPLGGSPTGHATGAILSVGQLTPI